MIIYCEYNYLNDDNFEVEASNFSEAENIVLIEDQKLYKYIYKEETGKTAADFKN